MTVAKKSPALGGTVVALIGPDGVGKSTQVARLAAIFGKKLRCTTVYLGSIASARKLRLMGWRSLESGPVDVAERNKPSQLYVLGSALSGLANAVGRSLGLLSGRIRRRAGAIVFSDRWPQNLEPGLLDGPRRAPARPLRIALLSSWMERGIYRRLEKHKPDLTIHLVANFETSSARKPGDIAETAFEQRLQLMRQMQKRDSSIVVVDADQELEKVTADLFKAVWLHLWKRAGEAPADFRPILHETVVEHESDSVGTPTPSRDRRVTDPERAGPEPIKRQAASEQAEIAVGK